MIARIFLALVGLLYLGLAIWCSVRPANTSAIVGFSLVGGGGKSEFLTVYGGLEFGLGLVFLWPLLQAGQTSSSLLACVLIHGSLVVFRSISFAIYRDIPSATYNLAAAEWAILLSSGLLVWAHKTSSI